MYMQLTHAHAHTTTVASEVTIITGGQVISKVRLVEEDNEVSTNWKETES